MTLVGTLRDSLKGTDRWLNGELSLEAGGCVKSASTSAISAFFSSVDMEDWKNGPVSTSSGCSRNLLSTSEIKL